MLFKNISIIDSNFDVQRDVNVCVKNGRIDYIGKEVPDYDTDIYDGTNKLLCSGFINAHTHTAMTLLRGYGENLPLDRWLNEKIFPFEAKLDDNSVFWASQLGIAEMLSFGTTSFSDMYFFNDATAKAVIQSGIKINMCRPISCFDDSDLVDLEAYNDTIRFLNDYHNSYDGRLKIDWGLHGEYTSTQKVVSQLSRVITNYDTTLHLHLSETQKEVDECVVRHGKTPVKYFNDLELFNTRTLAAHCVALNDEDIEILSQKNVFVVHNPVSNLKLGSGIAPIYKLIKKGVTIALGTDSVASNNNLDMLEELKLATLLHKCYTQLFENFDIKELLKMLSLHGAMAQGRPDTGLIEVGKKADITVIDLDKPHLVPNYDLRHTLIFSAKATDVVLTMVDGKILYKNGEYMTVDIEKAKFETSKNAKNIISRLV
ncbi:MAG: amidohydrolase [Oscillospiraceae bacterium]